METAQLTVRDSGTSQRIFWGTVALGSASALQRAAPVLLLPLFARFLSPEEFGAIGIAVTLSTLLATLAGFGLETAVFRGYIHAAGDPEAVHRFVNSVGGFGLIAPLVLAVVVSALAAPAIATFFGISMLAVMLGFVGAALNVSATIVPLALLRAQERVRDYFGLMSLQVVVTVGSMVLFVAIMDWGVTGWMAAVAIAAASLLVRALVVLDHRWSIGFSGDAIKRALLFGVPLIPHMSAHWALAVSDRAILGAFVPTETVGAYYVAFLVTLPINLAATAVAQATQPLFAEATASAARREELGRIASVQAIGVALLTAAVALLGPPAVLLLLPPEYEPATAFIPWLALGAGLFGLYLIPMNAVSVMLGHTRHIWMVTVSAATFNVALNLALVPRFGAVAAAVNTTVGYMLLFVGVTLYARRVSHDPINLDVAKVGSAALLTVLTYVAGTALDFGSAALTLLARATVMTVAAIAFVTVGPLRQEAKSALRVIRPADDGVRE